MNDVEKLSSRSLLGVLQNNKQSLIGAESRIHNCFVNKFIRIIILKIPGLPWWCSG